MRKAIVMHRKELFTSLILVWIAIVEIAGSSAQQRSARVRTFAGSYDSEYSYPIVEGKAGKRDLSAVDEIKQATDETTLSEGLGIEAKGLVSVGTGKTERQYSVSLAVEKHGRFRMDSGEGDTQRSIRSGKNGVQVKQGNGLTGTLNDVEFGDPLALPEHLREIINREDSSVVEDGLVSIDKQHFNKVTVSLFNTKTGIPVAASFYFDTETHLLRKSVFSQHVVANNHREYLKVVTYSDYRTIQSVLYPLEYTESVDGQLLMSLKLTSAHMAASHNESYFTF